MRFRLLFLLFTCATLNTVQAQEAASDSTANKQTVEKGKLYLAPIPILASNPAFGFIYGAAVSGSMFLGEPSNTNLSNGLLTATYSTKEQLMFTFKSNIYSSENKWFYMIDWRLFFSSQPTFGLGTGPQAGLLANTGIEYEPDLYSNTIETGQMMDFNLVRFHQSALREIKPSLYAGIGYHLDIYSEIDDKLLDLESDPPTYTSHYIYSTVTGFDPTEYTVSGVSANVTYDTRDNINYPYEGRFAFAQFKYMPEFLGSDQEATSLWLEYRDYYGVSKKQAKNTLAFWTYLNLTTSGTLPYMALPALGWDQMGKSGRAYPQGRFRGENLFYFEAEYRMGIPILKKKPNLFGAAIFANATSASVTYKSDLPQVPDLDIGLFEEFEPAAGVGLRITLMEKTRTNIALDYGWGANGAGAFYLNLNEYF